MKTKILSYLKYVIFLLLFTAYFYLESKIGIRAFAIALFFALVYCKQNILILSPLYMIAGIIVAPTLKMLIFVSSPVVIIAIAMFIHYKAHKKLKMLAISIYMLLAEIPVMALEIGDISQITSTILGVLGAQILLYTAIICLYAVLIKQLKFALTQDEILSFMVFFASIGAVAIVVNISWYTLFYTLLAFIALCSLFVDGKIALMLATAYGIGGALATGEPYIIAISVLYGAVVMCFNKKTQYFAGIGILAVDVVFKLLFSPKGYSYFSFISPAIGVALFFCIPNKIKNYFSAYSVCFKERMLPRTLINRDRKIVADKIKSLSGVFFEMQDILHIDGAEKERQIDSNYLTHEVCSKCCGNCSELTNCKMALGGSETDVVVSDLVLSALDNGRATILDTPPFLSSRCKKINGIINTTNDLTERYRVSNARLGNIDEGRTMLSSQMGGVGTLLNELQKQVETNLLFDTEKEQQIITELSYANISATEVVVYNKGGETVAITIVLREQDSIKPQLLAIISAVMGYQMEISEQEATIAGMCALHLTTAPKFSVVYGDRESAKSADGANGDRHSALKIASNKVMLILSDGMGSGKSAAQNSGYCLNMIESFYRAGFDHQTIASSVGKLLSLRSSEEFNAVDIAVIDTYLGAIDFIKQGGRESFIVNSGVVEVVECGSLPMGIIAEAEPIVTKCSLSSGSFVVMVSDGVIDVIGREGIITLLEMVKTNNPDVVAEIIMNNLINISGGKKIDDASVLVARVVAAYNNRAAKRTEKE